MIKDEWGLVLSGGGAKGAYEIGVWKAIRELNMEHAITAVSGTSVGSLNAALFAQGDYETAEQIWTNISMQQILSPKNITTVEVEGVDDEIKQLIVQEVGGHLPKPLCAVMSWIQDIDKKLYTFALPVYIASFAKKSFPIYTAMKLAPIFISFIQQFLSVTSFKDAFQVTTEILRGLFHDGLFSQDGLESIINQHVDAQKILESKIALYMHSYNVTKIQEESFFIDESNIQDLATIMLASSALPAIYEDVLLNGDRYIDGGIPIVGDNVPVDTLYNQGYRKMIVVGMDDDMKPIKGYPDSLIYLIKPQSSLGGVFRGTLNFRSNYARKLIQKGYEDAIAILKDIHV